jgi:hypothetical protein
MDFLLGLNFMAFGMPEKRLSSLSLRQKRGKYCQLDILVFGMPKTLDRFFWY